MNKANRAVVNHIRDVFTEYEEFRKGNRGKQKFRIKHFDSGRFMDWFFDEYECYVSVTHYNTRIAAFTHHNTPEGKDRVEVRIGYQEVYGYSARTTDLICKALMQAFVDPKANWTSATVSFKAHIPLTNFTGSQSV